MIKQPHIALTTNRKAPRKSYAAWMAQGPQLYGTRGFGVPFLAATTRIHMGVPRHVLSQMVVAGVMFNQPPVKIFVETPAGT